MTCPRCGRKPDHILANGDALCRQCLFLQRRLEIETESESRCDDCGGVNPIWFAPNDLWNFVIGGPEAKDDPGGFICPACFIARAKDAGITGVFELRVEGSWT